MNHEIGLSVGCQVFSNNIMMLFCLHLNIYAEMKNRLINYTFQKYQCDVLTRGSRLSLTGSPSDPSVSLIKFKFHQNVECQTSTKQIFKLIQTPTPLIYSPIFVIIKTTWY